MISFKVILRRMIIFSIALSLLVVVFNKNDVIYEDVFFMFMIGLLLGLFSFIYDLKTFNIRFKVIIHYLTMVVTIFPMYIFYNRNSIENSTDVLILFLKFTAIGIILLITNYFITNNKMNIKK